MSDREKEEKYKTVYIVWSEELTGVMAGVSRIDAAFFSREAAIGYKNHLETTRATLDVRVEEIEVLDAGVSNGD